ncbi:hypothetical protein [Prochlorococcus sp. MIT 1201]|uniref:hypothetical protein n=1 Tax=Prochlorococcus sp. MIT 1201 TaxID=3082535 RepID=UPI0039A7696C
MIRTLGHSPSQGARSCQQTNPQRIGLVEAVRLLRNPASREDGKGLAFLLDGGCFELLCALWQAGRGWNSFSLGWL